LRALGAIEPPAEVFIGAGAESSGPGCAYHRLTVFKHDSWAATALYQGSAGLAVCKFNRQQSILGWPMHGLGRILARREMDILDRLADLPGVPRLLGPVYHHGRHLQHACARTFIPGHPLSMNERVPAGFFDRLEAMLDVMHRRGIAYVDLHKRENILVGDNRVPYLIDFQISFALPRRRHGETSWMQSCLRLLQEADRYHLDKHRRHALGDRRPVAWGELPWFIRAHRMIGVPVRELRRRLLVALGTRTGHGRAESEVFPEDAIRRMLEERRAA
jgi:hypothetical protein